MNIKVMSREEIEEVRTSHPNYNKVSEFIEEFVKSGAFGAEMEFTPSEYKSASSCYQTLHSAIVKMHLNHIEAFTRKGHVYIINKLAK